MTPLEIKRRTMCEYFTFPLDVSHRCPIYQKISACYKCPQYCEEHFDEAEEIIEREISLANGLLALEKEHNHE